MPRALRRSESSLLARAGRLCLFSTALLACREQQPASERRAPAEAQPPAAERPRVRRPAPSGAFDCKELRPAPKAEGAAGPETIELVPPGDGKKVFFSKTGERVTFDRDVFLRAARCMGLEKAVRYVEEETGKEAESPLMDTFQLSYVVAALLDAGRAGVRLEEEREWRKTIVRDAWAADACAGRCRSFGRIYRLSPDDSAFFLRITDGGRDY